MNIVSNGLHCCGLQLWYKMLEFNEICRKPISQHPGLGSSLVEGFHETPYPGHQQRGASEWPSPWPSPPLHQPRLRSCIHSHTVSALDLSFFHHEHVGRLRFLDFFIDVFLDFQNKRYSKMLYLIDYDVPGLHFW